MLGSNLLTVQCYKLTLDCGGYVSVINEVEPLSFFSNSNGINSVDLLYIEIKNVQWKTTLKAMQNVQIKSSVLGKRIK